MTNINVAITIWWRTVLLNALFTGMWAVFEVGLIVLPVMIALVIGGFIVTLPLLPVISLLLKVQSLIPYGSRERFTWLSVMLVVLVWIIYTVILLIGYRSWPSGEVMYYLAGMGTSLAVLAALAFTKKSILSVTPGIDHFYHHNKSSHV